MIFFISMKKLYVNKQILQFSHMQSKIHLHFDDIYIQSTTVLNIVYIAAIIATTCKRINNKNI